MKKGMREWEREREKNMNGIIISQMERSKLLELQILYMDANPDELQNLNSCFK